MLFLNVAELLKSLFIQNINYKVKFDFTGMISWKNLESGLSTLMKLQTAVKRAHIISAVFLAQDSVQGFCSSTRENNCLSLI